MNSFSAVRTSRFGELSSHAFWSNSGIKVAVVNKGEATSKKKLGKVIMLMGNVSSRNCRIHIWQASNDVSALSKEPGKRLCFCHGHTNYVISLVWSNKDMHIVSSARDHTIRVWRTDTGQQLSCFTEENFSAISPNGLHFICKSKVGNMMLSECLTDKRLRRLEGAPSAQKVEWSPCGRKIMVMYRNEEDVSFGHIGK